MADELEDLKDRLADLTGAVDELLARQRAQQPTPPPPAEPPPAEPPAAEAPPITES